MLGWILLPTLAAGLADIEVSVRAGRAGRVDCAVRGAPADRLARTPAGDWRWRRVAGEVLTCSSPGFEPLDVEAAQPGLPPRIHRELWPARSLTLLADGPVEGVVEWRGLGEAATVVIARQPVSFRERLELPVAHAERVVRILPNGLSPLSLFLPAGAGSVTWRVGRSRPGGELFGRLPAIAFPPVGVEVSGPGGTRVIEPDARRVFQASSLVPGAYTLAPVFRGGLRGRAQKVGVPSGQTVELLPWALPAAGALSLRAAAEVCVAQYFPARLQLRRVNAEGGLDPRPLADLPAPPCERDLEGLEEGTYEASLRAATGAEPVGTARVAVLAGRKAQVRLEATAVRLSGRVTMGREHPAPGVTLVFENDGRTWTARSDENGEYRATLGAAGDYRVSLPALADVVEASFTRSFRAGDQTADFSLGAGAVHVRAARDDAAPLKEAVQVTLTARSGRRFSSSWDPDQEREKRFLGLEPGVYWVTAASAAGLVSQGAAPVELTLEQPLAEVDLVLGRHEGLLEVVDEAGGPVTSARVDGHERVLTASGPNTFTLQATPLGEWLKVRASGFLTACRIVREDDLPTMRVVLRRTLESVTLYLDPQLPWDAGRLEAPGSDCPLSMSDLEYEAQPELNRTTVKIRLPRGRYQLAVEAVTRAVEAPGADVTFASPAER
jgi:hypothetical protein